MQTSPSDLSSRNDQRSAALSDLPGFSSDVYYELTGIVQWHLDVASNTIRFSRGLSHFLNPSDDPHRRPHIPRIGPLPEMLEHFGEARFPIRDAIDRLVKADDQDASSFELPIPGTSVLPPFRVAARREARNSRILGVVQRSEPRVEETPTEHGQSHEDRSVCAHRHDGTNSTFLATVSHEFRTPMNGVLGLLDQLLDSELTATQRELAETARFSAHALHTLIDDVLDFSRLESGVRVAPEPCELRPFLDQILAMHLGSAHHAGIELQLLVDPLLPRAVMVDPARLRQVLTHLVANAVKFTLPGGSVTIRAQGIAGGSPHPRIEIAVVDTGIGIAEQQQTRIFRPFEQGDSTMSRRFGGTGLGLALASRSARLIGGEISVQSKIGLGSTFRILFDAPEVDLASRSDSELGHVILSESSRRALRILLAEDNLINQRVIVRMLEQAGHSVKIAANGLEAVAEYVRERFDIVLMDIQMPVMDGDEAFRFLRGIQEKSGHIVPVIAVTANALESDRERYLKAGMHGYVPKPVQKGTLMREIGRAMLQIEEPRAPVAGAPLPFVSDA